MDFLHGGTGTGKNAPGLFRKPQTSLTHKNSSLLHLSPVNPVRTVTRLSQKSQEAVDMLRYHAEIYKKQKGFVIPTRPESTEAESRSVMRPYGVWAVISPFNFPLSLAAGMAGAALITGNTIVLKPTSIAPFSVLKLFYAFIAAGVPPDAIQYITGPGAQFGDIVTAHKDIAGIAFTGSRAAGMWLHRTFAARQRCYQTGHFRNGEQEPGYCDAAC